MKKSKSPTYHVSPIVKSSLHSFGLTDNEIIVYTACLKDQETSPYALAKVTGVPRTTIYDVLMSLSLKGLVKLQQSDGFTKQQTRITANNPSVLRKILRDRRQELTHTEVDILEILPLLKGDYHQNKSPNADFQFFPGIEGAEHVLFNEDAGPADIEVLAFENLMPMDAFGSGKMDDSVDQDTKNRLSSPHPIKELVVLNDWTKHVLSYQFTRDPNYIIARQIRYLDHPVLDFNQRIAIKGKRVMITCTNKDEAWGIIVKSSSLSSMLTSLFQFGYLQATPITPEIIKSWPQTDYQQFQKLYQKK